MTVGPVTFAGVTWALDRHGHAVRTHEDDRSRRWRIDAVFSEPGVISGFVQELAAPRFGPSDPGIIIEPKAHRCHPHREGDEMACRCGKRWPFGEDHP